MARACALNDLIIAFGAVKDWEVKYANCGVWQFAPLKAKKADRNKRDPRQICLAIYFHFKAQK